jgi:arsenite methyltransferase
LPSMSVMITLLRELTTRARSPRIPEPDLVMDDGEKVTAYVQAGREHNVMAPVYLFHVAQICEIVRPHETVIDLGCGPAIQLAMVARLNPRTRFVGLDLSSEMLTRADAYIKEQNLSNVELQQTDIANLKDFRDHGVDAAISTVTLHHLPDFRTLESAFSELRRVLKPEGGLYLVDFGHLRSEKSIQSFAYQYADRQAELFTMDYLYSLRAAFRKEEFRVLHERYLSDRAKLYSTFLIPFMVALKSRPRKDPDEGVIAQLHQMRDQLPDCHKTDLADLRTFFRLGGLRSPLLN